MSKINFFFEIHPFSIPNVQLKKWLTDCVIGNEYALGCINFIFCDDEYLLKINKQFLSHDYYTDIITFDNSYLVKTLEADLFISSDRVRENAESLRIPFDIELYRVMIHGVLHLLGYKDKTKEEMLTMRKKEEEYLLTLNVPRGTLLRN